MTPAPEPGRLRVLQVAAEVYPLVKTGGLADVVAALPAALLRAGADVRLLVPGHPAILQKLPRSNLVALLGPAFGAAMIMVRQGTIEGIEVPVYVIDAPALFDRPGSPYQDPQGRDWSDNPLRYALLGWVAAHLGLGDIDRNWRPQIVHAHDWHAALAPAYLKRHPVPRCASVYTIHNLAFQGLFHPQQLPDLMLPPQAFTYDGLEFHGQGSFMKAGLQFADKLTTVSPTYAREIQTVAFGCGLEGVIAHRAADLHGILNGIDAGLWNPAADPLLPTPYDATCLERKALVKDALQRELGLAQRPRAPMIAVVSRLTQQKGLDLLLDAMPSLLDDGVQLALLGSGEGAIQQGFGGLAAARPDAVGARFGYDEALAHRIIAGADLIVVPSRFEPCGLTQMYGLRYGTVPVVRRVGGLADTVVDASPAALAEGRASGFVFDLADTASLLGAVRRAIRLYEEPDTWQALMRQGMAQDFSWAPAARELMELYTALAVRI